MPAEEDVDHRSPTPSVARVVAVAASTVHGFSKETRPAIRLLEGLGVQGDAHHGVIVQHLSRLRRHPAAPNLRQVHLLPVELFDVLGSVGHRVVPGDLGENVATAGVDLLGIPTGTVLALGPSAEVEVTGLRNPCRQIDAFQAGLLRHVLARDPDGGVRRLAGVMGVVRRGGDVRPGDAVTVVLPAEPHRPLHPV
jgi:MOSC domain-containing protein YiiM